MASEAIESIKQAELSADKMIKAAENKAKRIFDQAKAAAEKMENSIMKEARAKANLKIGIEQNRAERATKEILYKVRQESISIKNLSKEKHDAAVKLVLEKILSK